LTCFLHKLWYFEVVHLCFCKNIGEMAFTQMLIAPSVYWCSSRNLHHWIKNFKAHILCVSNVYLSCILHELWSFEVVHFVFFSKILWVQQCMTWLLLLTSLLFYSHVH
jgi:hypothetical protein